VSGEVHLLPIGVLRERGLLERTVRHQIVHLLTKEAFANRPAWVSEGAALYFAGEHPALTAPKQWPPYRPSSAACPSDSEVLRPVSVGALANADLRARACFAKQLEKGRRWDEIK
jgi:hypothetical protein